jgi:transcriptional regulator with XRE-family HTH domain
MAERSAVVDYQILELAGMRCAVISEAHLLRMCEALNITPRALQPASKAAAESIADASLDKERLARRLSLRRRRAGLSQAELARRAGIRVETLNRIERGHTTPDFATVRKLVVAMDAAEAALATETSGKE